MAITEPKVTRSPGIPGWAVNVDPTPAEVFRNIMGAGAKGQVGWLMEQRKTEEAERQRQANILTNAFPTLISQGVIEPTKPGETGSMDLFGISWKKTEGPSWVQSRRTAELETTQLQAEKLKQQMGMTPMSASELYVRAIEIVQKDRMYQSIKFMEDDPDNTMGYAPGDAEKYKYQAAADLVRNVSQTFGLRYPEGMQGMPGVPELSLEKNAKATEWLKSINFPVTKINIDAVNKKFEWK